MSRSKKQGLIELGEWLLPRLAYGLTTAALAAASRPRREPTLMAPVEGGELDLLEAAPP